MFEFDIAWANKKSVDLLCPTGCVATTRPFADGLWEFGDFDAQIASKAGQATTAQLLMQAGADPTIESFFSETAMEVAQQELAYWLVDTAEVQSVLTQNLTDGEKQAMHEAFSKQMQQKQLNLEEAISKHRNGCQQMKAALEQQKKTTHEDNQATVKATEHANNKSQCCTMQ